MSTGIAWTDETWNPVVGCTKVSQGCKHCYAKTIHDMRHEAYEAGKKVAPQYAYPFETVQLKPERLARPLSWRKPRRVFVNSVSDLFHEDVPDGYLDQVFVVMALASQHTFQVLTKRPERMHAYMPTVAPAKLADYAVQFMLGKFGPIIQSPDYGDAGWIRDNGPHIRAAFTTWPLPNVWLGVSIESESELDRASYLIRTPAAVRFVSAEPLLSALPGLAQFLPRWPHADGTTGNVDWVIAGGESGAKARPCELDWLRQIRDDCAQYGAAYFLKQLGGHPNARAHELAVLDGQTHTGFPQ